MTPGEVPLQQQTWQERSADSAVWDQAPGRIPGSGPGTGLGTSAGSIPAADDDGCEVPFAPQANMPSAEQVTVTPGPTDAAPDKCTYQGESSDRQPLSAHIFIPRGVFDELPRPTTRPGTEPVTSMDTQSPGSINLPILAPSTPPRQAQPLDQSGPSVVVPPQEPIPNPSTGDGMVEQFSDLVPAAAVQRDGRESTGHAQETVTARRALPGAHQRTLLDDANMDTLGEPVPSLVHPMPVQEPAPHPEEMAGIDTHSVRLPDEPVLHHATAAGGGELRAGAAGVENENSGVADVTMAGGGEADPAPVHVAGGQMAGIETPPSRLPDERMLSPAIAPGRDELQGATAMVDKGNHDGTDDDSKPPHGIDDRGDQSKGADDDGEQSMDLGE